MYKPVRAIEVRIWGKTAGAMALDPKLCWNRGPKNIEAAYYTVAGKPNS